MFAVAAFLLGLESREHLSHIVEALEALTIELDRNCRRYWQTSPDPKDYPVTWQGLSRPTVGVVRKAVEDSLGQPSAQDETRLSFALPP